jgi:hypothetical protein
LAGFVKRFLKKVFWLLGGNGLKAFGVCVWAGQTFFSIACCLGDDAFFSYFSLLSH